MSTSSISSSMFGNLQQFQQLGTDLSSGNLTAAQSDFAALLKEMPQSSASTANSQSSSPLSQAIGQLSRDLKSGNLKAAQQDYASLRQDFQSRTAQGHHRLHGSGGGGQSQFSQLFSQLGQDLQYGDLSSAQSSWSSMQQLLQSNSTSRGSSGTTHTPISVTA